jgi:hypothetical protein
MEAAFFKFKNTGEPGWCTLKKHRLSIPLGNALHLSRFGLVDKKSFEHFQI